MASVVTKDEARRMQLLRDAIERLMPNEVTVSLVQLSRTGDSVPVALLSNIPDDESLDLLEEFVKNARKSGLTSRATVAVEQSKKLQ